MKVLALARKATNTDPTAAQIDSGNYAKGELRLHGLRIKLENPRGSIRRSKPGEAPVWERKMVHDYGYICGVEGADGDAVDVFIGPHPESELAVVVDQVGPDGRFDESKVMLGFLSEADAVAGYLAHYPKGWKLGKMTALTMGQFKEWLARGKTQRPVAGRVVVLVKADVKAPGSKHGRFYINSSGKIRYGIPPKGAKPFKGIVSRKQAPDKLGRRGGLLAGEKITGPEDTAAIFRNAVNRDRERLWVVHLDQAARPTTAELVSDGTVGEVIAHPREIFKNALQMKTAAVALMHSHTFDDPTPSPEDLVVTARCGAVGQAIGIPVRHHVVISKRGFAEAAPGGRIHYWDEAPRAGMRRLQFVHGGEMVDQPIPASWGQVLERRINTLDDIAHIGNRLFDPVDQTAIALTLTNELTVIGVHPFAMGTIGPPELNRLTQIAIATNAHAVAVTCGRDGPQWQSDAAAFHHAAAAWFDDRFAPHPSAIGPGIQYVDTIIVGQGSFWTMRKKQPGVL